MGKPRVASLKRKKKSDYNNIHVCEHLSHMLLGIRQMGSYFGGQLSRVYIDIKCTESSNP